MDKNKEKSVEKVSKDEIDFAEIEASAESSKSQDSVDSLEATKLESKNTTSAVNSPTPTGKKPNRFKRFLHTKKGKVLLAFGVLLLVAGILFAIPTTRYGILGNVLKKNVQVMVMDSATMKPVSQATVSLAGKTVKTNKTGEVTLENIPVGEYSLKITKGYYKASEEIYTVPVLGEMKQAHVSLVATGRQVVIHVTNKISGAVLAGATIAVNDTSAITDDKGEATIVLPADKKTLKGTVKIEGYNEAAIEVKVSEGSKDNTFSITPSGTIYYLSKQTGKINIMKSQLDGSAASVVVEGTGNERDQDTVLLAARDWSYMTLSAKRDTTKVQRLYVLNAKTGKLDVIDEGTDVNFQSIGWSDHRFIYIVNRYNKGVWEPQKQSLKSYNAETGKLVILDDSGAEGKDANYYDTESIINPYILEGKIVYAKTWNRGGHIFLPSDKKSAIITVNSDGSNKQQVKEFSMRLQMDIRSRLYEPQSVYFRVQADGGDATYYEYENNALKTVTSTDDKFNGVVYPTYLLSPTGQKTFWYESRDGKNFLFVGDKDGKDALTVSSRSEYKTYGWYSDKYLLVTKNDSELYITPADKPFDQPLKITNYHKPDVSFPGYGYGYGGQ